MCLTTYLTTYMTTIEYLSGCRVTVTHLFWEQVQAGSTPVIPTTNPLKQITSEDFYAVKSFSLSTATQILSIQSVVTLTKHTFLGII